MELFIKAQREKKQKRSYKNSRIKSVGLFTTLRPEGKGNSQVLQKSKEGTETSLIGCRQCSATLQEQNQESKHSKPHPLFLVVSLLVLSIV